jgi:hypothetical protein
MVCIPHPRIQRFRKGSPAPVGAAKWLAGWSTSGHV